MPSRRARSRSRSPRSVHAIEAEEVIMRHSRSSRSSSRRHSRSRSPDSADDYSLPDHARRAHYDHHRRRQSSGLYDTPITTVTIQKNHDLDHPNAGPVDGPAEPIPKPPSVNPSPRDTPSRDPSASSPSLVLESAASSLESLSEISLQHSIHSTSTVSLKTVDFPQSHTPPSYSVPSVSVYPGLWSNSSISPSSVAPPIRPYLPIATPSLPRPASLPTIPPVASLNGSQKDIYVESTLAAQDYIMTFATKTLPQQIYLHFLLRLPSLYFSRVDRIFKATNLTMEEIKEMALQATAEDLKDLQYSMLYATPYGGDFEPTNLSPAYRRLKGRWEQFIDSLMREWKTLNIVSVLLLSAIMTMFQIQGAAEDPVTRYIAFWSLLCALMSLLYGCLFIIRFGTMRKASKAAEWALEAQKSQTVLWNVWVMLAMPVVWLAWSILTFIACIMSFMWRAQANLPSDFVFLTTSLTEFAFRTFICVVLGVGILYGALIINTFRRYGTQMDEAWQRRVESHLGNIYPIGAPPSPPPPPPGYQYGPTIIPGPLPGPFVYQRSHRSQSRRSSKSSSDENPYLAAAIGSRELGGHRSKSTSAPPQGDKSIISPPMRSASYGRNSPDYRPVYSYEHPESRRNPIRTSSSATYKLDFGPQLEEGHRSDDDSPSPIRSSRLAPLDGGGAPILPLRDSGSSLVVAHTPVAKDKPRKLSPVGREASSNLSLPPDSAEPKLSKDIGERGRPPTSAPPPPEPAMSRPHSYVTKKPSLLQTPELPFVIAQCKKRVEQIAKDCRAGNRKFRDPEFDLENDQHRCLYGLFIKPGESFSPSDVLRTTKIFKHPEFFADGRPDSTQIVQGGIGDCWFLSALSSVATAPGLLEQLCVARDESVGVYGFIFFRDNRWVDVIVDDLLCTRRPKFEDLTPFEQSLYHDDKDYYLKSASVNEGKTLYFARSGARTETWVPLIEKAYAKLHGHYAYLHLGKTCEAMEDLTGGVSKNIFTNDILDSDRFWNDELLRANKDRLFTCQISHPTHRAPQSEIKVQGLVTAHAYAVLRAVESKGRRFVVLRNPWGKIEWTGRWSDGSKEWTKEWINLLDELGHSFGEDGQFIMEYDDWLECFTDIDRTILFDSSWRMSSQWLRVRCRPLPTAFSYGDVSFTFTLPSAASTVISLAQLNTRYFRDIASRSLWTLDFVLVREGEEDPIIETQHTKFQARDVSAEVQLEAGAYIVYARLDRLIDAAAPVEISLEDWHLLKLSRIMTKRAEGRSIASNVPRELFAHSLPVPLDDLIHRDKRRYEKKQSQMKDHNEEDSDNGTEYFTDDDSDSNVETITKTTTTVVVKKVRTKKPSRSTSFVQNIAPPPKRPQIPPPSILPPHPKYKQRQKDRQRREQEPLPSPPRYNGHTRDTRVAGHRSGAVGPGPPGPIMYPSPWAPQPNFFHCFTGPGPQNQWSRPTTPTPPEPPKDKLTTVKWLRDDEHEVYIGLRVYVNAGEDPVSEGPIEIVGRIGESSSDDEDEHDLLSTRGRSMVGRSRSTNSSLSRSSSQESSISRSRRRRPLRR
ncbi:hypothetical protein NP233_g4705 [Leucocoprinus birnbaumii]|uniref:Calpain catalytic domain-containing protein n=1 Tax=Leucocoprinus birnbaumii TaxID=56174 RepID=A0AAD5YRL9_9AGAR|nr:hypothetical protein NP233_g4705 [Leucocoprinus birnbaumii]